VEHSYEEEWTNEKDEEDEEEEDMEPKGSMLPSSP
jgi:hypothetical protein